MSIRCGYRWGMRARLCLPALLCLAIATAGCSAQSGTRAGVEDSGLSLVPEEGEVRLVQGSRTLSVRSERAVSAGDRVQVADGAVARLTHRERTVELWGGSIEVISPSRFHLLSGKLLVQAASPIRINAGDLRVSATQGVFRVDEQLATRVANYSRTSIAVESASDSLRIPAYRQVVTVQGILPRVVQPLRFSPSDRWDRRLLSEAIDLDARVSNFAEGLEAQLGEVEGLALFERVVPPGTALNFLRPHLANRRSDLLIGLMLSAEAARLRSIPLDLRFDRIFGLWTQGASWGLLAQEFGVASESLFSQLTQAVGRAQIQVIGPGPGLVQPPSEQRRPGATRRPRAVAVPSSGSSGASPTAPARPSPGVLPQPLRNAVPGEVTKIVDDLLGVVDPVADLPAL